MEGEYNLLIQAARAQFGTIIKQQGLKFAIFNMAYRLNKSFIAGTMLSKKFHGIYFVFLLVLAIGHLSCIKEYSYEGGVAPPVVIDSTVPPITLPVTDLGECSFCNADRDNYEENRWSFKVDSSILCGIIDTAILTPDRDGFTFFGPGSCPAITTMVITVYPENHKLDRDYSQLTLSKVIFTYGELGLPKFLLSTQRGLPFSLTIESYNYQTKMAIGTFSGDVVSAGGKMLQVSGKFKVKLI